MTAPIFLTGATGFVGRRLVARLADAGRGPVTLLCRRPADATVPAGWRIAVGNLRDGDYRGVIEPGSLIVHLAALTGRGSRSEFERVNVAGTAALLDAARSRGAAGIVFVSSIAAGYPDQRFAWYARSKAAAERLVAASGLPYTIVRPTQVMGQGSPVAAALAKIANLPVPLVFGSGRVTVQPIGVDDLVTRLLAVLEQPLEGRTVECGGDEVLSIRELILRLRDPERPSRKPWSIPIEPLRTLLGWAEPVVGRFLPFTAGQLSAFANDGAAGRAP